MSTILNLSEQIIHAQFAAFRKQVLDAVNKVSLECPLPTKHKKEIYNEIKSSCSHGLWLHLCRDAGIDTQASKRSLAQDEKKLFDYINKALAYSAEIDSMSTDEIIQRANSLEASKYQRRLEAGAKSDKVAWWNRANCLANKQDWANHCAFTADEAVALSLGKDPMKVNSKNLGPLRGVAISPFKIEYDRRIKALERNMATYNKTKFILRRDLISFFESCGWSLELIANSRTEIREKEEIRVHKGSLNSLYAIILGLAQSKYNFSAMDDFLRQRSEMRLMHAEMIKKGIQIDYHTLEKHFEAVYKWARTDGSRKSGIEKQKLR